MTDWGTTAVQIAAALVSAGSVSAAFNWWRAQKTVSTDNAVRLSAAAMEQVNEYQEAVAQARTEADAARHELAETRQQVLGVNRQLQELTWRLQWLSAAIHDPHASLPKLRAMVSPPNEMTQGAT